MSAGAPTHSLDTMGPQTAPNPGAPAFRLAPRWNDRESEMVPVVAPPSVEEFRRRWLRSPRPVVLRGAAEAWAARRAWSIDRVGARFGDRVVPLVRVRDGMLGYDEKSGMDYERLRLDQFLESLRSGLAPEWFLTVRPSDHFPELLDEIDRHPYSAGASWSDFRVSIGAAGTTTPIHVELLHNLFTVLHGEKEVVLFAPSETRSLQSFGVFSGAPHISPVDPRTRDEARWPGVLRCKPRRCVLRSGDALFIPRGWWHAVRTNEPTIAMGAWWAEGVYSLVPRALGVYKWLFDVRT